MDTEHAQEEFPEHGDQPHQEACQESPPDGKPHRKKYERKNTFQRGNKAYRGGGGKRVRKSTLYRDCEYVLYHQNGPFKSDAQRFLKQRLDENPDKFLAVYKDLEKAHLAKTEKVSDPLSAGGKDAPSLDENSQRCLELVERLLKTRGWEKNSSQQTTISEIVGQSIPSGAG